MANSPVSKAKKNNSDVNTSVRRCVDQIRALIVAGEFLPGQALRQGQLAERLETSRIPVREALGILEAEGVVSYEPYVGHTVVRLNDDQLKEIYTMRRLLESELMASVNIDDIDVDVLTDLYQRMEVASEHLDVRELTQLNVKFHFYIFDLSPYKIVLAEISRLWNMSGFYRSTQIYDESNRQKINNEHQRIIEAIKKRDMDELIRACDDHRAWRQSGSPYTLKAPMTLLRHDGVVVHG